MNQAKELKIRQDVKHYRLALKIKGNGEAHIQKIHVEYKRELNGLDISSLRQLGYDQPSKLSELRLAIISDAFTTNCIKHICKTIQFGPEDWKAILEIEKPHMLFVESAWEGNDGRWTKKIATTSSNNTIDLLELIAWCKKNNIPTVFWNKEDPVHFNSFIQTAKNFDYVFTTDEDSISNYVEKCSNQRVFAFPFAAQPYLHNPIEEFRRSRALVLRVRIMRKSIKIVKKR